MIIGLTGTFGAGKGEAADYLSSKGFAHYPVRGFLAEEIEKRGWPQSRDSMNKLGNELREKHSPSYIIEQLYQRALEYGGDSLIESIRAIGEAKFLKEHGAFIIAIDADRRMRYERITHRGASTDDVDFNTWVAQEQRELASSAAHDMNVLGVMEMADAHVVNEGTLEDFHRKIDAAIEGFAKK